VETLTEAMEDFCTLGKRNWHFGSNVERAKIGKKCSKSEGKCSIIVKITQQRREK
jgi:hypothetical protein